MKNILVCIGSAERGRSALEWAVALAHEKQARLSLLVIVDAYSDYLADSAPAGQTPEEVLESVRSQVAIDHPDIDASVSLGTGDIVESIVAASEGYDLVVLESQRDVTVGERIFGTKGLRIASLTNVATAVVPFGWKHDPCAHGIVVGVGPDDTSNDAVVLAVSLAEVLGEPLELVSAWGVPALIARSAEAMGGGLEPVGRQLQRKLDSFVDQIGRTHPNVEVASDTVEGSSPIQVIVERAHGKRALLLGTHERSRISRALLGSVTFGVSAHLEIPTIVVPEKHREH